MKIAFYTVGSLEEPICVCQMEAVPRAGESVNIDLGAWVVYTVAYVIMPNDEPFIRVLLEPEE